MSPFSSPNPSRQTNAERLLELLSDHEWHSTRELSRRISHAFAVAKFKLVHQERRRIEKRKHATRRYQYEYRLLPTERRQRSALDGSLYPFVPQRRDPERVNGLTTAY
jgi:hypothetical protein